MKLRTILLTAGLSVLFSMQAFAGWVQVDNGQWIYEENGTQLTGQWLKDNGVWYYLGADGIMLANTTRNIDGVDYTFDASGKWLDPASAKTGVYDGVYKNIELKFSMQVPAGIAYEIDEKGNLYLDSDSIIMTTTSFPDLPSYANATELADLFTTELVSEIDYLVKMDYQTNTQIGEFSCKRTHFTANEYDISADLYTSVQDNGFFCVFVAYSASTKTTVQNSLNSLKRLP